MTNAYIDITNRQGRRRTEMSRVRNTDTFPRDGLNPLGPQTVAVLMANTHVPAGASFAAASFLPIFRRAAIAGIWLALG